MIFNENGAVIIETGIEKVYNEYIDSFNNLVSLDESMNIDAIKEGLKKFSEKISQIIDKIVEAFNRLMDFIDAKSRTALVAIANEKKIRSGWRAFQDIMTKLKNNEMVENKAAVIIAECINEEMENTCLFNIEDHLNKYDKAVHQFYINDTIPTDKDDAEKLAYFYYDTLGKILIGKSFGLENRENRNFTNYNDSSYINSQIIDYFNKARSGKFNKVDDIINQAKTNAQVNRRISMVIKSLLKIKDKNFVQRKGDTSNSDMLNTNAIKFANIGIRILVDYGNNLIKNINASVNMSAAICITLAKLSKYFNRADTIDAEFTVRDAELKKKREKESKTNTNPKTQNNLRLTMA